MLKTQSTEPPWYVIRMPGGVGGEVARAISLSRLGRRARCATPSSYRVGLFRAATRSRPRSAIKLNRSKLKDQYFYQH